MKYSELFFISSFSQSNIYNFTFFSDDEDDMDDTESCNFLLIFYLKPVFTNETIIKQQCELISIGSINNSIHSTVRLPEFPELPVTAEVVSIDSFIDRDTDTISIILCLIKKEGKPKSMVHIYDVNLKPDCSPDRFKPNLVFKKDIGFNPLHVTHTKYWNATNEKLGRAYILSISDECLSHSQKDKSSPFILAFLKQNYQEQADVDVQSSSSSRSNVVIDSDPLDFFKDKKSVRRSAFMEKNVRKRSDLDDTENRYEESMPIQRKYIECLNYNNNFFEFSLVKQKILFMNFKINKENYQRISCFGSDCGKFVFTIVDMRKSEIVVHYDGEHNSPITSLRFVADSQFLRYSEGRDSYPIKKCDYHLLVCSAVECSVVYKNIVQHSGFSQGNQFCLPDSDQYDCVLCSTVSDVDMDGELEILIGSFQQYLLVYKWCTVNTERGGYFRLMAKLKCAGAIHSIIHSDFTRDGMKELIVLTNRGLHVYQLDPDYVQSVLARRMLLM